MFNFIVVLFSKFFGKYFKKIKLYTRRKFPFLYPKAKNFKNYRKKYKFSDIQLVFYFISMTILGITILSLFLIDTLMLKNIFLYIMIAVVLIVVYYSWYPDLVNLRKRELLIKRKVNLEDKISKLYIANDIDVGKNINFSFIKSIEIKKNDYISWEHELKLLAIEQGINAILNTKEQQNGWVKTNFFRTNKYK